MSLKSSAFKPCLSPPLPPRSATFPFDGKRNDVVAWRQGDKNRKARNEITGVYVSQYFVPLPPTGLCSDLEGNRAAPPKDTCRIDTCSPSRGGTGGNVGLKVPCIASTCSTRHQPRCCNRKQRPGFLQAYLWLFCRCHLACRTKGRM